MKLTLSNIGIVLAPIGIISAQFNKPVGAAILGSAITLNLVHIFQHYKIKKKKDKK